MSDSGQITDYLFQGYRLDIQGKCLFDPQGKSVQLSHRALDTLIVLIRNRGLTLSKATLMATVWPDVFVEENNLNQAITSIRKVLGDSNQAGRFIRTFKGKGYCFVAEVVPVAGGYQPPASTPIPDDSEPGSERFLARIQAQLVTPAFAGFVLVGLLAGVVLLSSEPDTRSADLSTASLGGPAQFSTPGNQPAIPDSIAVLPLTTLNPGDENRVFALGIHLELINRLSRFDVLKLISHNGVPAAMVREQPLTALGRLLNVEYIVTGSILLLDDNARLNLYLLDAETGVILWTDNYQADTDNLTGAMASRIALDIAGAMDIRISENDRQEVQARDTESFEAYRYQLASVSAFSTMDYAKAWTLSKQALELDPQYLDALHMFSRVNSVLSAMPLPDMTSTDHISLSLEAAEISIQLAPELPRGYMFKAVALGSSNQWQAAMVEVEKMRAMNVAPATLQFLAPILMSLGRFDETVEILEANLREEPINLHARGFLLAAHEMAGNRTQARLEYDLGEELNPEWWGDTVNVFLALGRKERIRDISGLLGIPDDIKTMLENINQGDIAAVSNMLSTYDPETRAGTVELVYYSAIAAYTGNHELAVDLMDRAVAEVGLNFHWMWLPVFDETRKHDDFKTLLLKAGLVDYWQQYGWPPYCGPVDDTFSCETSAYDMISMQ